MKLLAIIQARLASERLPNKILSEIGGQSMIRRVYDRVRWTCIQTVIAVPRADGGEIDQAVKGAVILAYDVPENEVLSRFAVCARSHDAQKIVRITADCPFISPKEILRVVEQSEASGFRLPLYSNVRPKRTVPDGWDVEVFTRELLEQANREATGPADREHVTPWMYCHLGVPEAPEPTGFAVHKFSIDTQEDLDWARAVAEHLDLTPPHPTGSDWRRVLFQHPELRR